MEVVLPIIDFSVHVCFSFLSEGLKSETEMQRFQILSPFFRTAPRIVYTCHLGATFPIDLVNPPVKHDIGDYISQHQGQMCAWPIPGYYEISTRAGSRPCADALFVAHFHLLGVNASPGTCIAPVHGISAHIASKSKVLRLIAASAGPILIEGVLY